MNHSTLPRHAHGHAPGWTHPYTSDPWTPLYADGGNEDEELAEEVDEEQAEEQAEVDEPDPEGAEDLGDKGKRALASMKGKWRAERDRAKELEQRLADKDGVDEAEQVRRKAEQDALSKANARIIRAEVKAAAAGKLADPADAYRFLDLDQFEVDENGDLDSGEVTEAIEDLIKSKPYLAAATVKRFQGTGDGGSARTASKPKQLSRQDLKTMSPAQIVKAKAEGRLDDALGISG